MHISTLTLPLIKRLIFAMRALRSRQHASLDRLQVCLPGYVQCNPSPYCEPGYGVDGVPGACTICRQGRFSKGGTATVPVPTCQGCGPRMSTPNKGSTLQEQCTGTLAGWRGAAGRHITCMHAAGRQTERRRATRSAGQRKVLVKEVQADAAV